MEGKLPILDHDLVEQDFQELVPLLRTRLVEGPFEVLHQVEHHQAVVHKLECILLQAFELSLDLDLAGFDLGRLERDGLFIKQLVKPIVQELEQGGLVPLGLVLKPFLLSQKEALLVVCGLSEDGLHPVVEVFGKTEPAQGLREPPFDQLLAVALSMLAPATPGVIRVIVGVAFRIVGRHNPSALSTPQEAPVSVELRALGMGMGLLAEDSLHFIKHGPVHDVLVLAFDPLTKVMLIHDILRFGEGPDHKSNHYRISQKDAQGRDRHLAALALPQPLLVELLGQTELALHPGRVKLEGPPDEWNLFFTWSQQVLLAGVT